MTNQQLLDLLNEAKEVYLWEAIRSRDRAKKAPSLRRSVLIAAAVALAALLVGCGMAYALHLHQLRLDMTASGQVLTLSGLEGSANYRAAKEWYTYRQDHNTQAAVQEDLPAEYAGYDIRTLEEAAAIQAIADSYGLDLIGEPVECRSTRSLWNYLGLSGILTEESGTSLTPANGVYYEGGGFQFTFTLRMSGGGGQWPEDVLGRFYYSPKSCFDPFLCQLSAGEWQEWNFTTASGETVLILRSLSQWQSWVFCDKADATVALMLETVREEGSDSSGIVEWTRCAMTDAQLEQVVSSIDFSLIPQPGDPALLEGLGQNVDPTETRQTQNGYTLELKSAQTDGTFAIITLGLTVPEDVPLYRENCSLGVAFGNCSSDNLTCKAGMPEWTALGATLEARDDGDGKDNTVDLVYTYDIWSGEADTLIAPGSQWQLYIEGLSAERWHGETCEFTWSTEGVWKYDITFGEGDFRSLECIREPITIETRWTEDDPKSRQVTLSSFKLRSLSVELEDGLDHGWELADPEKGLYSYVVLTDGRKIRLAGTDGLFAMPEMPIPLDEVAYVELFDGTRLTPNRDGTHN